LVLCCFSSNAEPILQPFTSDGCSVFPDGNWQQQQLWLPCCTAHDVAYWQGGTAEMRADADAKLQQCVAAIGQPEIAQIMQAGVRVGGTPYLPTPFRWGYGWSEFRGYQAHTEAELAQIRKLMTSGLAVSQTQASESSVTQGMAAKNTPAEQVPKHTEIPLAKSQE
jgi:hypothetical protein